MGELRNWPIQKKLSGQKLHASHQPLLRLIGRAWPVKKLERLCDVIDVVTLPTLLNEGETELRRCHWCQSDTSTKP